MALDLVKVVKDEERASLEHLPERPRYQQNRAHVIVALSKEMAVLLGLPVGRWKRYAMHSVWRRKTDMAPWRLVWRSFVAMPVRTSRAVWLGDPEWP